MSSPTSGIENRIKCCKPVSNGTNLNHWNERTYTQFWHCNEGDFYWKFSPNVIAESVRMASHTFPTATQRKKSIQNLESIWTWVLCTFRSSFGVYRGGRNTNKNSSNDFDCYAEQCENHFAFSFSVRCLTVCRRIDKCIDHQYATEAPNEILNDFVAQLACIDRSIYKSNVIFIGLNVCEWPKHSYINLEIHIFMRNYVHEGMMWSVWVCDSDSYLLTLLIQFFLSLLLLLLLLCVLCCCCWKLSIQIRIQIVISFFFF